MEVGTTTKFEELEGMEYTHKILYMTDELEVFFIQPVSPPFILGKNSVKHLTGTVTDIPYKFIIVEKEFEGEVTQEMLTDFQRNIAYSELDKNFSIQQMNLMSASTAYEEYMTKEMALRKLYFDVKNQIPTAIAPFLLNLNLDM
jgi:hypothetical protein